MKREGGSWVLQTTSDSIIDSSLQIIPKFIFIIAESEGVVVIGRRSWWGVVGLGGIVAAGLAVTSSGWAEEAEPAAADDSAGNTDSQEERIERVESKIDILAEELSRALTATTVPEAPSLLAARGLGPSASKVYFRDKGLSIGGYGEVRLRTYVSDNVALTDSLEIVRGKPDDIFDALRAVLYVGYKFNEHWLINSEFEFEHAGTGGGGSVSTEFLTVDYLATDYLGLRFGLVLIPMGFINEIHEPTTFFGSERPEVERQIIPSTWRENGAGVFGAIGDRFHYRMYAVNGFDASGFTVAGLRGGRQKGSRALANNWAFVARGDVDIWNGLTAGGSVYTGKSGQSQTSLACISNCNAPVASQRNLIPVTLPDTLTTIYEAHAEYKGYGLSLRGLFTQAFIQDAAQLNWALDRSTTAGVASQMLGWYAEIGYDLLPLIFPETKMSFEPFFRYERVNTQQVVPDGWIANRFFDQDVFTVGASYKPITQVVFKLDYRNFRPRSTIDDRADQVQASVGFIF